MVWVLWCGCCGVGVMVWVLWCRFRGNTTISLAGYDPESIGRSAKALTFLFRNDSVQLARSISCCWFTLCTGFVDKFSLGLSPSRHYHSLANVRDVVNVKFNCLDLLYKKASDNYSYQFVEWNTT